VQTVEEIDFLTNVVDSKNTRFFRQVYLSMKSS